MQTWTDQIKAHLELLNQLASRLPAGERLEVKELNDILNLTDNFKGTFLLMMEIHGFELQKKQ